MKKLEEKRELIRVWKEKVSTMQYVCSLVVGGGLIDCLYRPDNPQYQSDHKKLQEMEDELKYEHHSGVFSVYIVHRELEKLEKEVIELLDSQKHKEDDQSREVRKGSFMKPQPTTNGKQENPVKSHIKVYVTDSMGNVRLKEGVIRWPICLALLA